MDSNAFNSDGELPFMHQSCQIQSPKLEEDTGEDDLM